MFAGILLVIGGALELGRNSDMYTIAGSPGCTIPDAVTKWPETVSPGAGGLSVSNRQDRWSNIVSCEKCGRNNPADILLCLNCGQRFKQRKCGLQSYGFTIESQSAMDPFRKRPYSRANALSPFIAQRSPEEILQAIEVIREEAFFSWDADGDEPGELTDAMIADAESTIRLRLPAALLAILKMRNGGRSCKEIWDVRCCPLPLLHGIAAGSGTHASLQEMPQMIWDVFESFLDEDFYLKWWATLNGKIHPAWSGQPRIPESILLIAEDLHWGVGLNYVACGPQGEPSVVHVEMEGGEADNFLLEIAPDFMTFLRMLELDED